MPNVVAPSTRRQVAIDITRSPLDRALAIEARGTTVAGFVAAAAECGLPVAVNVTLRPYDHATTEDADQQAIGYQRVIGYIVLADGSEVMLFRGEDDEPRVCSRRPTKGDCEHLTAQDVPLVGDLTQRAIRSRVEGAQVQAAPADHVRGLAQLYRRRQIPVIAATAVPVQGDSGSDLIAEGYALAGVPGNVVGTLTLANGATLVVYVDPDRRAGHDGQYYIATRLVLPADRERGRIDAFEPVDLMHDPLPTIPAPTSPAPPSG